MRHDERLSSLVVCAGGGGLTLGLEGAGFDPTLLLDNRHDACEKLRLNRPDWDVRWMNLLELDPAREQQVCDVDLLAAGLPRLKASAAVSRTRSSAAEEELVAATIALMSKVRPRALLIDNIPDLVTSSSYEQLRAIVEDELAHCGYSYRWVVVNAADVGVPQDRRHGVLVAASGADLDNFEPPDGPPTEWATVGQALRDSMAGGGWPAADDWAAQASGLAPTVVGGSWERGGADLGPTGSKRAWARIGVDGGTVADEAPPPDFVWDPSLGRPGMVKLTVEQVAILQGFPADWHFVGRKTSRYRQVANAMPPPLARTLGLSLVELLR